jgi:titin
VDEDDAALHVKWSATFDNGWSITSYSLVDDKGHLIDVSATTLSATLSSLTNGTSYCVRVQAKNEAGAGPFSAPQCATPSVDAPSAPGGFDATHGDGRVDLDWNAATPNRTPVASYEVVMNPGNRVLHFGANARSTTVTGLNNGTAYTFTITAKSESGHDSAASGAGATPSTLPWAVINFHAYGQGGGTIQYDFGPSADDGGAPVTRYSVYLDGAFIRDMNPFGAGTISGLVPGQTYSVTITPWNLNGEGGAATLSAVPQP